MALSAFERAFASARRDGKKTFTFGGKSYNTRLADDKGSEARQELTRPRSRPSAPADSGRPKARNSNRVSARPATETASRPSPERVKGTTNIGSTGTTRPKARPTSEDTRSFRNPREPRGTASRNSVPRFSKGGKVK